MAELGYDLAAHASKSLDEVKDYAPFDAVVTMGAYPCVDICIWVYVCVYVHVLRVFRFSGGGVCGFSLRSNGRLPIHIHTRTYTTNVQAAATPAPGCPRSTT